MAEMKRIFYSIIIFGFLIIGINSAAAPAVYLDIVLGTPGNILPNTKSLLTVTVWAVLPAAIKKDKVTAMHKHLIRLIKSSIVYQKPKSIRQLYLGQLQIADKLI